MIRTMQKLLTAAILIAFIIPVYGQVDPYINLGGGYDYNLNKYYQRNQWIMTEGKLDFNASADPGLQLGKGARFHAMVNYVQFTYGQNNTDPSEFLSEIKVRISSMSLTPALDVKLWSNEKMDLYITAGYLMEWVVDLKETNKLTDGTTSNTIYKKVIDANYKSYVDGPTGGLFLKYNINKNLGITFEPSYTYFLKKFYDKNDLGNLQRISASIGVEYLFRLQHKKKTDGFEE
jgi:hypothetical protein